MNLDLPRVLTICLLLGVAGAAAAHEVPARVVVDAYVRPEGATLDVLLRVPLGAMRDMEFPQRGPGYLDIAAADGALADAARLWLAGDMTFFENGRALGAPRIRAVRVSLPSDRSFTSYPAALSHLQGPPLPADTELYWEQGLLDVSFEYPIVDADAEFAMDLRLARLGLRTFTVLHFLAADGSERVYSYQGDLGRVSLDPGWLRAAGQFVAFGFRHVLSGLDHLLFVFCLVLPVRRLPVLVMLVTAFTLAHSLTLAAAALGMTPDTVWFAPLVETLIALSILYLAVENFLPVSLRRRWLAAFGFGLVHGFGFALTLSDSLQFAGSHLVVSLAGFNVGIELGQLLVVVLALGVLSGLFRLGLPERFTVALCSVIVAHTAWHWMLERGSNLRAVPWSWPVLDAAWWAGALRWLMLLLAALTALWLLHLAYRRWADAGRTPAEL